jgi:hypothetical protein
MKLIQATMLLAMIATVSFAHADCKDQPQGAKITDDNPKAALSTASTTDQPAVDATALPLPDSKGQQ